MKVRWLKSIVLLLVTMVVVIDDASATDVIPNWDDFVNTSDFIVCARAVKLEEISKNHYRTTFSIQRTYKGIPPDILSIE